MLAEGESHWDSFVAYAGYFNLFELSPAVVSKNSEKSRYPQTASTVLRGFQEMAMRMEQSVINSEDPGMREIHLRIRSTLRDILSNRLAGHATQSSIARKHYGADLGSDGYQDSRHTELRQQYC